MEGSVLTFLKSECNFSEVIDPIAFIFGRMVGHDVQLIIFSRHFCLKIFVGVMGLYHFHAISISTQLYSVNVTPLSLFGPKAFICSRIIDHDLLLIILYCHFDSTILQGLLDFLMHFHYAGDTTLSCYLIQDKSKSGERKKSIYLNIS